MKITVKDKVVSISGKVTPEMSAAFLALACRWESTAPQIKWKDVRDQPAMTRRAWVDGRKWFNLPVSDTDIKEIFITQPATVLQKFVFAYTLRDRFKVVVSQMTLQEVYKFFKACHYGYEAWTVCARGINKDLLPIILVDPKAPHSLQKILEEILSKG